MLHVWSVTIGHGRVYTTPGLVFSEDNDVIPDLIWISRERLEAGRDASGHITLGPDLVVESLSPGTANERRDRVAKLGLYSRRGVDEYWIADYRQQQVEVFRRGESGLELAATLGDEDTLTSPLLAGFTVRVADLWEPV
jgi:Uma2 family endonuclease